MPAIATAVMGDVSGAARASLDEARAGRVYQEGLAMELEQAVAYALQPSTSDESLRMPR